MGEALARDVVVGIDSSTTAAKAIAWSREGEALASGRAGHALSTPAANLYEQEPEDWWRALVAALRDLTTAIDPARIAGIAIAGQRETVAPLDAAGTAIRPAMLWLDERGASEIGPLAEAVGADRLQAISGKPVDVTPAIYRIAWMRRHEPELFARTAHFADAHGYLAWRLTGRRRTSLASADAFGLFDMRNGLWSEELTAAVGLRPDRLFPLVPPGARIGAVTKAAAAATGLRAGTPVLAGGGDGQLAGLGVGALRPERGYLNLGTALVSGVFSSAYRVDRAWRTIGAGSGDGFYYETCVRTGTFLVDWFVRRICGVDPVAEPGIYGTLAREAETVPIGAGGVLLLPYWSGAMNPYWDPEARGVIVGLAPHHGRGHLYRALLEGVALEQAISAEAADAATGAPVERYVAIGGGARCDMWCRIMADATGRVIERSTTIDASSLGAGICAAAGAGLFPDIRSAAAVMTGTAGRSFAPDPDRAARYLALLAIYRQLYPALRGVFGPLARFAAGSDGVDSGRPII